MRGLTTLVVFVALFTVSLLVAIPVFDALLPIATEMAPGYTSTLENIHAVGVKWIIPIFLATVIVWAVFWILRTERQQVR